MECLVIECPTFNDLSVKYLIYVVGYALIATKTHKAPALESPSLTLLTIWCPLCTNEHIRAKSI